MLDNDKQIHKLKEELAAYKMVPADFLENEDRLVCMVATPAETTCLEGDG